MRIFEIANKNQLSLWDKSELPKIKDPNRNERLARTGGVQRTYPNWDNGPKVKPIDSSNDTVNVDYEISKQKARKGGHFPFDSYSEVGLKHLGKPFTIKEKPINFIRTLKQQCEEPNLRPENNGVKYECILNAIDNKYNAAGVRTKTNNIVVRFGIGTSNNIPNNLRVINPSDTQSKEQMIEELKTVLKPFESKFEKIGFDGAQTTMIFKDATAEDKLNVFWKVVDTVESMGPDFVKKENRGNAGAGSLITGIQAPIEYYRWLARNVYNSVKENYSWGFSRGGEGGPYDRYDNLIIIGITPGGIKQKQDGREPYREHVVPCDFINRMAIKLCQDSMKKNVRPNKIIKNLMELIHRNLAIVLCSSPPRDKNNKPIKDPKNPTDQEIIDEINGWRETMPPEWKDGDNILARFTESNIPVYGYKNDSDRGKRIAE